LEGDTSLEYLLLLGLHRLTQRWNQTGQKFAGEPDIVHSFCMPHPILLWSLVALTYLTILFRVRNHLTHFLKSGSLVGTLCSSMLCVSAFAFKLGFTANDAPELIAWLGDDVVSSLQTIPLVGSARIVFLIIGSEVAWAFASRWYSKVERISKKGDNISDQLESSFADTFLDLITTLHTLLTLFLVTQTRVTNIPLYFIFINQEFILSSIRFTHTQITISTLLLGYTSFFALGNSNAISSIDLSNAYNGVSGYNVLAVGVLVFASNWAGPIWWSLTAIKMLVHNSSLPKLVPQGKKPIRDWVAKEMDHLLPSETKATAEKDSPFFNHIVLLTVFTSASVLAVMVACTILRTHLFIWTVFSPKYLYTMAWSLAFHFFVSIGLGGGLWLVCGGENE
jgi:ethanolaminephosphotransferase